MLEWLKLSDLALAQKLDYEEKYGLEDDKHFRAFFALRSHLSLLAWNAYAAALNCDAGPLSRTGVIWKELDATVADRLNEIMMASPKTELRRDDFAMGYLANAVSSLRDYLNASNEYREVTPDFTAALRGLLATIGPEIERDLGHPFRIGSIRQFQLQPDRVAAYRHIDGWPPSIRKLFILPRGAGRKLGTTWFRLRNGEEIVLDVEKPIWVLFENSVVWHAPVSSDAQRPTIEVDLLPAPVSSFEPFYAGINGWYPWFPTEDSMLQGTRAAAQIYAENQGKSLLGRLLKRAS
jgi:hypothetical protein